MYREQRNGGMENVLLSVSKKAVTQRDGEMNNIFMGVTKSAVGQRSGGMENMPISAVTVI